MEDKIKLKKISLLPSRRIPEQDDSRMILSALSVDGCFGGSGVSVIFLLCVDPDPERAVCLPSVQVETPCAGEVTAVSVKPPPSSRCVVCVAETALTLQAC